MFIIHEITENHHHMKDAVKQQQKISNI